MALIESPRRDAQAGRLLHAHVHGSTNKCGEPRGTDHGTHPR